MLKRMEGEKKWKDEDMSKSPLFAGLDETFLAQTRLIYTNESLSCKQKKEASMELAKNLPEDQQVRQ